MKIRKSAVSTLALIMIASTAVPAQASVYSDVNKHWAKTSIERMSGYGAISGFEGKFRPNDYITRGEMAVVIANLMEYQTKGSTKFTDLDNNFYRDAIQKLNGAGVMNGSNGLVRPKDRITRQEAMVMLANAFAIDQNSSAVYGFKDGNKVASWALGSVGALVSKGFVSGDSGRNLRPNDPITRAELVAIADRMVGSYANTAGTKTANTASNAVVTSDGVEFEDAKIAGNVVITDKNKGITTLEDTTVGGKVLTSKSMKELRVRGDSSINNIEVKGSSTLAIDVSSTSNVRQVNVKDAKTTNITGNIKEIYSAEVENSTLNIENCEGSKINVRSPKTKVSVKGYSDIGTIDISKDADESTVSVAKETKVSKITTEAEDTKMTINGEVGEIHVKESAEATTLQISTDKNKVDELVIDAEDVKVNGSGVVRKIYVKASGVNISVKDATVYVSRDAENVIVSGEKVKPGSTVNSSNVEDDTDWDEVSIDDIEVIDEKTIMVTLDNDGEDIETALKKANFEITGKSSGTDDPEISNVSVKNSTDVDENTVYQIKLNDELEDDEDYRLKIYLPDGETINKTFSVGDLNEDEYPEVSDVKVTRISATQAKVEFEASEDGDAWFYVVDYDEKDKPSASDIKDDGEEEEVDDGDNTVTIDGLKSGEKYKLYVVTKNRTTSKVYGAYTIPENTLVESSSIKAFNFDSSNNKFEFEITDELSEALKLSNVNIVGPRGTLSLSDLVNTSGTKYKVNTSTELVDGTYTLKITFKDGTVRQDNVSIDVQEEEAEPAVAPSLSDMDIARFESNDKKVTIQFTADEDGKAYIMEGRGNSEAVVASGKQVPVEKGENIMTFTLSASDVAKLSIVSVSTDGTQKSDVYVVVIPEIEVEDNTGNEDNTGGNTGNEGENTGNTGSEGENTGSEGENTGSEGENTGSEGENTGSEGENTTNTASENSSGEESTDMKV